MLSTKAVTCGRWEASLPWVGRLQAGLPALSVSGDLENLAALRDGGI